MNADDVMRIADDYADQSRSQQIGMPSTKRAELYDVVAALAVKASLYDLALAVTEQTSASPILSALASPSRPDTE